MLNDKQSEELLKKLKLRFEKNVHLHEGVKWETVEGKLEKNPKALASIFEMEKTGGEPDVVVFDDDKNLFYVDSSLESPKGRRSLCYDQKALEDRKEFKPKNSAEKMAKEMGIEILDEEQYRFLQTLGKFDEKTSSWLKTPSEIRKLGGAIFADRRYDHVFVFHNGADSYYASRGFRGIVKI